MATALNTSKQGTNIKGSIFLVNSMVKVSIVGSMAQLTKVNSRMACAMVGASGNLQETIKIFMKESIKMI